MNIQEIENSLRAWGIPFAVIADLDTGNAVRVGNSTGWRFDDLDNGLFGDTETVLATCRSLEGQILPRMWKQGDVYCVVCKPNERTVVGLFFSDQRNPVELYHWTKQLNARVARVFADELT